jgi:hypothetical protein
MLPLRKSPLVRPGAGEPARPMMSHYEREWDSNCALAATQASSLREANACRGAARTGGILAGLVHPMRECGRCAAAATDGEVRARLLRCEETAGASGDAPTRQHAHRPPDPPIGLVDPCRTRPGIFAALGIHVRASRQADRHRRRGRLPSTIGFNATAVLGGVILPGNVPLN